MYQSNIKPTDFQPRLANTLRLVAEHLEEHPETYKFQAIGVPADITGVACFWGWVGFFDKGADAKGSFMQACRNNLTRTQESRDVWYNAGSDEVCYSLLTRFCSAEEQECFAVPAWQRPDYYTEGVPAVDSAIDLAYIAANWLDAYYSRPVSSEEGMGSKSETEV